MAVYHYKVDTANFSHVPEGGAYFDHVILHWRDRYEVQYEYGIYNASKDEFLMRPLEAAYHGTALDGSSWDTLTAEDKDVFIDNDINTQNKDKLREEIKASLRSLRLLRE